MLCHFTMNFLRSLFTTVSVLVLVEKSTSLKSVELNRISPRAALALIQKKDSSLELAIPYKIVHYIWTGAGYNYDDSKDEEGRPENEFMVACPAFRPEHNTIEQNWKNSYKSFADSKLLFLHKYTHRDNVCISAATPTIQRIEKSDSSSNIQNCQRLEGEIRCWICGKVLFHF